MGASQKITVLLPQAMVSVVQRVRRVQRRSMSEIVREALGLYCRIETLPGYKPTARELRAVEVGRAAFRRRDYVTLDEYRNELEGGPKRARQKSARSARNKR